MHTQMRGNILPRDQHLRVVLDSVAAAFYLALRHFYRQIFVLLSTDLVELVSAQDALICFGPKISMYHCMFICHKWAISVDPPFWEF